MKDQVDQEQLIADFVSRRVWAVVGASQDPGKFGHRIFRSLREAGYVVYPVNPKGGMLEDSPVYSSLADLPQPPDVVDLVVPPRVTYRIVQEAHRQGLSRIWMQPGAESQMAIQYCQDHGLQVVYHACAMVHRRFWGD